MTREPRVPRVEPAHLTDAMRSTFDAFVRERSAVPNLFRVAAHAPRVANTLADHLNAVMDEGQVPPLLKELLSVRVSLINLCDY